MKNITSHSFFTDSPLSIQLCELESFIDEKMRVLIKVHKNAIDEGLKGKYQNPLISSHNQFISIVERFILDIETEILKLSGVLIWKNTQYIMSHDLNIIYNFMLGYNEEMNKLFFKVKNNSISRIDDFMRENKYEAVGSLSKNYLSNAEKKHTQSYKYIKPFIKKMQII